MSTLYRSSKYHSIAGVCAGFAISRGYSIAITRLVALFLFGTGIGAPLYLAAWIVIPSAKKQGQAEPESLPADPFMRSRTYARVAGVCGGIAKYFHVDPNLVRVSMLLLFFVGGVSLIPYFYAWAVVPRQA